PAGIWQITPDGGTTYVNAAMCRLLDADHPEMLAGRNYRDFFTPASVETIRREHSKRRFGLSSTYEAEIVSLAGTRRSVLISGAPLMNPDGSLSCMIATVLDITQRKQDEERLRESEERLRMALSAGEMGAWDWDLVTGHLAWNDIHIRLFGLDPNEF